jgi:LmbE family N-acetylglucosaminyl deacetylase
MENWYIPYQTAQLPAAQKVWVLAPHPDDEVFGCAGAVLSYAAQNAQVHVTVVSGGTGYAQSHEAAEIQSTREAETNAALQLMGLGPAQFMQLPDRGLTQCADLIQKLVLDLQQHQFDVVLTPSLDEVHPDHLAVTHALIAALEQLKAEGGQLPWLVQYEVGAPLKPNLLLDLTALWPRKLQAMQCYKSQQQSQDYAKHIEALNIYRTYSLPASVSHAEAYLVLKPEEVLQAASENRWMNSVLSTAEAGAEALQLQVISKDQLIARLQDQGRIDIQAMRDQEQALLKRVELLGDELKQLGIENERKRVEIERLSNVTVAVQDELSLVKNSLAHTQNELAQTQNELAHEQAQRQIMLNSNSWRITKPLRWFMQLFSSNQS